MSATIVRRLVGGGWGTLADLALTAGLLVVSLLIALLGPDLGFHSVDTDLLGVALLTAIVLPVCWRRRWPFAMLALSAIASVPYHALGYFHEVAVLPVLVLVYAIGVRITPRRLALVVLSLGLAMALVDGLTEDGPPGLGIVLPLGWLLAAAVTGAAVRLHRAYIASIMERAERAERTREEVAARRVAEERLRIARDLHDVLAHHMAVINAHAGVAAHLLTENEDDPAIRRVAEPLQTIADTSSMTMSELRATLDVLRGQDADNDRQPVPGVEQIPALLDTARLAGVSATMEVAGKPRTLGRPEEITLYRIAQEALTNVVKHAEAATVTLALEYAAEGVTMRVTDDGNGPSADCHGYGILGMAERAAAVDGRLSAGAADHGGFVVAVFIPTHKAVR